MLKIEAGNSIQFACVGTHEIKEVDNDLVFVYDIVFPLSEVELLISKGVWKLVKEPVAT
jgi:hypothetical protein